MKTQLHKEHFEAWLFAQPRDRIIEAGSTSRCFICSFLKETDGRHWPMVDWISWTSESLESDEPFHPLPYWAKQLISRRWLQSNSKDYQYGAPVTVGQMQDRWLELWPETNERITTYETNRTPVIAG